MFNFSDTHEDCETLMQHMDYEALAERGDIVWQMPREWTFTVTNPDGRQTDLCVRQEQKLYVGFFDIGVLSDGTVHRLHLRTDHDKGGPRNSGEALALRVTDVIRRCTAHVRLIDHDYSRCDQHASVAAQAYSLHVWAAPDRIRVHKLQTGGQQKRTVDTDSKRYADNSQRWPYNKKARS